MCRELGDEAFTAAPSLRRVFHIGSVEVAHARTMEPAGSLVSSSPPSIHQNWIAPASLGSSSSAGSRLWWAIHVRTPGEIHPMTSRIRA